MRGSDNSENANPYFSANLRCVSTGSGLIPSTKALCAANESVASRKSQASAGAARCHVARIKVQDNGPSASLLELHWFTIRPAGKREVGCVVANFGPGVSSHAAMELQRKVIENNGPAPTKNCEALCFAKIAAGRQSSVSGHQSKRTRAAGERGDLEPGLTLFGLHSIISTCDISSARSFCSRWSFLRRTAAKQTRWQRCGATECRPNVRVPDGGGWQQSLFDFSCDSVSIMRTVPLSRIIIFCVLAIGGLAADLASKQAVFQRLGAPDGRTPWLMDSWVKFQFFTTFNHGALWGIGQGWTGLFALLSVLAVIGVFYWLFVAGAGRSWWLTVALALVMAGTLGNLWDRAGMHGYTYDNGQPIYAVRDFLHFRFGSFDWAIFNIADVCLVVGAIMLGLQSLRPDPFSEVANGSLADRPPVDIPDQSSHLPTVDTTPPTEQVAKSHR